MSGAAFPEDSDALHEDADDEDPAYTAETKVGEGAYLQIAQFLSNPPPNEVAEAKEAAPKAQTSGVRTKRVDEKPAELKRPTAPPLPPRATPRAKLPPPNPPAEREDDDAQEPTQVIGTAWIPNDLRSDVDERLGSAGPDSTTGERVVPARPPLPPNSTEPIPIGIPPAFNPPDRAPEHELARVPDLRASATSALQARPSMPPVVVAPPQPYPQPTPIDGAIGRGGKTKIAAGEVVVFLIAFFAVLVPSLLVLDRFL